MSLANSARNWLPLAAVSRLTAISFQSRYPSGISVMNIADPSVSVLLVLVPSAAGIITPVVWGLGFCACTFSLTIAITVTVRARTTVKLKKCFSIFLFQLFVLLHQ